MPLVTKEGFKKIPETAFIAPEDLPDSKVPSLAVAAPNDTDPSALVPHFNRIELIAIDFPSFADGRGFSLAKHLRRLGFTGELRARGHVISDQYPHALAVGFDSVEISDAQAERQPFDQWQRASGAVLPPYRLKKAG